LDVSAILAATNPCTTSSSTRPLKVTSKARRGMLIDEYEPELERQQKNKRMKSLLIAIAIMYSMISLGQAEQHLQSGIAKHDQQDFKGAIKDYDKAINEDRNNKDAYFNRGTCKLALADHKSALNDFNKTLELDPNFAKGYYSRATLLVSQEKYAEALPDLDRTIELDPKVPNALTLRGQIRAQTGNKPGACEDFTKAKEFGDVQADKYLAQFCGNEQQIGESLMLNWPESENWKVGSDQENDQMAMIELIPANETLENWTEFGSMISIKGAKNIPMDEAMNMMYAESKKNSPKAKLTFMEKDESVEHPWIIFTIESPSFKDDKRPESQLWYIVQGKHALYTNFRAVRKATISPELKEKWTKFFKTGEIVNK
nr:tetratricopeptide repeat protein [Bacteroidota bacterium]